MESTKLESEPREKGLALATNAVQEGIGAADQTRTVDAEDAMKEDTVAAEDDDDTATKEPGTDSGRESSQANQAVSHSLVQSPVSDGTDRKTLDDSRKGQCSRRGGGGHEEEGMHMPEELLETIISRIPFPSVFKVQTLSKSWLSKFPQQLSKSLQSVSLQSLQSVKSLQSMKPLQSVISSVSPQWPTYGPVYFTGADILGFDHTSFAWKSIADLSYCTEFFDRSRFDCKFCITTAGPLLLCYIWSETTDCYSCFVTNVITRCWKKLPKLMEWNEAPSHVRILPVDSNRYTVLLIYPRLGETHIYCSSRQAWGMMPSYMEDVNFFAGSAYLNETLYCLYIKQNSSVLTVATYPAQRSFWMEPTRQTVRSRVIRDSAILVCEDKVMAAVWFQEPGESKGRRSGGIEAIRNMITIFQLDFTTLQLEEVARGPPVSVCKEAFGENKTCHRINFASNANFLYFGENNDIASWEFRVIAYDVISGVWSCLPPSPPQAGLYDAPMTELPFQPGLNPFIAV